MCVRNNFNSVLSMDTKKQRQCSEVIEGLNLPPPPNWNRIVHLPNIKGHPIYPQFHLPYQTLATIFT